MNYPNDKTVLIINNSADWRESMRRVFEQAGFNVLTASDGGEGFEIAAAGAVDLVISDAMTAGGGIEFCRRIRTNEKLRSLPVLLVSDSRKEVGSVVEGLEVGADDYIELTVEPLYLIARAVRLIERKRMEDALRESEKYFRSLIENVSDLITILSLEGAILYESPSLLQLLGYESDELNGKHAFDFVHPDDTENVIAYFQMAAGSFNTAVSVEFRFKHKNGGWRILESLGKLFKNQTGETVVLITSRDITERRQAEKALRDSEAQLQAIFNNAAIGISLSKIRGTSVKNNPALERMFGYTDQELRQKSFISFTHPDDVQKTKILLARFADGQRDYVQLEKRYIRKDNTEIWCNLTLSKIPGDEQQLVIAMIEDITKRKRAEESLLRSEERLRQSQKLESIGRLAGGIAHDFNNMLTAINGYSELTLRKLDEKSPLRHNVEEIKKAGERSALLTQQLLAFSRRQVLQSKILDLNELITDTTKMLERLIGEDVRLETILDSKLSRIKGDNGQLTQVIMNLAVNARDAMPHGGHLIIETADVFLDEEFAAKHFPTQPGSYVMLSVADNGAGMDEEMQKNIFEPFYTTKETGKGTGLGLATVYGIVKQSGGFIWLNSEIGSGSTFKIYLPCMDSETGMRCDDQAADETAKKTEKILIVEDEDLVRDLMCRTLEECGYQVVGASGGIEALEICAASDGGFDLVITDVVMPQMGGRELAEQLSENYPQIRVLFTSGYTDDEILRRDVIKKATNFIQKPFNFAALAAKVRELLDE